MIEELIISYSSGEFKFSFADNLLLADELMSFIRLEDAEIHLLQALKLATDEYQRATIYLRQARIAAHRGKEEKMNELFGLAAKEYLSLGIKQSAYEVFALHTEWQAYLLSQDSCEFAKKIYNDFDSYLSHKNVLPATRGQAKHQFNQMLSNQNNKCSLVMYEIASEHVLINDSSAK